MALIPDSFGARPDRGPTWEPWLDTLPRLVRDLLEEWTLTPDGASMHGNTALVMPVLTAAEERAVLKVGWPHPEAEHEALALQRWAGRGAVRLLRADPKRWALLLERLEPVDLSDRWDVEACEIVAGLYADLHRPAPPQLPLLSAYAADLARRLAGVPNQMPIPHRLVDQARALARDLATDPGTDGQLVHTDLHFTNVMLSGDRGWVAIDPKPISGEPAYELAPMLWNRYGEYAERPGGRIRDGVRDRFFALVDGAGLDEHRARDWAVVRLVSNVVDELSESHEPDRGWVSAMVTLAKAVQ